MNLYQENLNYIKNISQDKLISDLRNCDDNMISNQPSIYKDIYIFNILKDPYKKLNKDEILYYRKEWGLVELVTNCLEKTFKNNKIKSNYKELINCEPYLINGDVIKEIILYIETFIKNLKNKLKNNYNIIEDILKDEIDMYERWLSDFRLLDINKEYAFVIWY